MPLGLPGPTDPGHRGAHRGPEHGEVQLLFSTTGGERRRATWGSPPYTFAIRRPQSAVGADSSRLDGTDGVAVLMRCTLRLLTAQQR